MKRVYYIGPSVAGVTVVMPDGTGRHVDHSTALETTDEHAAALLAQSDNWTATKPKDGPPAGARAVAAADERPTTPVVFRGPAVTADPDQNGG